MISQLFTLARGPVSRHRMREGHRQDDVHAHQQERAGALRAGARLRTLQRQNHHSAVDDILPTESRRLVPLRHQMTGGSTSDGANGRYFYGEGGGCINRPIREVWATSMNQGLMVWTEKGNSGSYTMAPPPAGVERFFDVEYTHSETAITVKWNMTWFHSVLAGTPQKPERILINYRRYKGTKYIKYWEGSIILTRLTDTVTAIWIRNQINATRVNEVNAKAAPAISSPAAHRRPRHRHPALVFDTPGRRLTNNGAARSHPPRSII